MITDNNYNNLNRVVNNGFPQSNGRGPYSNYFAGKYFKKFTTMALILAGVVAVKMNWDSFVDTLHKKPSEFSQRPQQRFDNNRNNFNRNNNRNFQRR